MADKKGNTGNRNTGDLNTGDWNTGDRNTGYWNTGDRNTGYWNTGDRNTGDWNTGNRNTGYLNTGNLNTGDRNTGDRNTGNRNTGDRNTGDRNTGNRNTGNWNTGDLNTGYLNTGDGKLEFFGKPVEGEFSDVDIPDFFYHKTAAVWVPLSEMSEDEIAKNKGCETVEGFLKVVSSRAGWRTAWDNASDSDRRKCLSLPNWNNEMFKEISGIDVEKELDGGRELTVAEVEKLVGFKVKIVKESK